MNARQEIERVVKSLVEQNADDLSMEDRLRIIKVFAYGKWTNAFVILDSMSDDELVDLFTDVYEALLQSGRMRGSEGG